jgi:hypothetical protein
VEWKTATWGRSGQSLRVTSMPARLAGLCRGASGMSPSAHTALIHSPIRRISPGVAADSAWPYPGSIHSSLGSWAAS